MNSAKDILSYEDAKEWLLDRGYSSEELSRLTEVEVRILATDERARKEAAAN